MYHGGAAPATEPGVEPGTPWSLGRDGTLELSPTATSDTPPPHGEPQSVSSANKSGPGAVHGSVLNKEHNHLK